VTAERPTGQYRTMVGLRPALGRLILPDDDRAGAPPVIVFTRGTGAAEEVQHQAFLRFHQAPT
jgi:hypothetical protein